jgi:predicted AAA+ superfamily ATPase
MENKKEIFKILIKEFEEFKIDRILKRQIGIPLNTSKIITVSGPRRCGKTFYFYQLINELKNKFSREIIVYINFEDDRILPLNFKELDLLVEAYFELYPEVKDKNFFLFLDEIQNIENWEVFVRRIYDKEKVKLFVTGSSSKLLSQEIATSLRGRTLNYKLYPLNFSEFLSFKGVKIDKHFEYSRQKYTVKKLLDEYINYGGFPEVVLDSADLKRSILKNYYELVIYRDIVERYSIRNINFLKSLIRYLFTNVSNIFSIKSYYISILKEFKISWETVLEYISYLEEIELIYLVPIFSYSLKVQQVNPKKLYVLDNGLRNVVSFKFSSDEGRLVENVVFNRLKEMGFEVYYWKGKGEVDFVFIQNNKLTAINVSYTDSLNSREAESLLEFKNVYKKSVKDMIIITKDTEKVENSIVYIPLWKWLLIWAGG